MCLCIIFHRYMYKDDMVAMGETNLAEFNETLLLEMHLNVRTHAHTL